MIVKIIIFLLWCVYASIEGVKEAYLYHYRNTSTEKKAYELHPLFAEQRSCVLLIITALSVDLWLLFACIFVFSFFHDGFYYVKRNDLNSKTYPKRFFDHSTTSTAKFEFTLITRYALLVLGLAVLTYDLLK